MIVPQRYLATGIPGLDTILGGGLDASALVFIVGNPGAGKTVLASQILMHAVQTGAKALIMTAFSEGHVKLIEHLRPFAFFDEAQVGEALTFLSLPTVIAEDSDAAASALARIIRESGARVVLLDGFQGIVDLFPDRRAVRRMLSTLAVLLSYVDVTLLLTMEGSGRDPALTKDLTTADVVIALAYEVNGLRHTRYIEVIKQRGRGQLAGLHPYTITDEGVTVFLRLEARPLPAPRPRPQGRASFGLSELDGLLAGGLNAGTVTVLAGAPGAGKTTLGLHWALAGADPERRTVFVGFGEREAELRAKAAAFGLDLEPALASGALVLHRLSPAEPDPDIVASQLLDALTVTTDQVVIDDISGLVRVLGARVQDYLAALSDHLYAAGVTSLFLVEIDAFMGFQFDLAHTPLSLVADNVMIIQQVAVGRSLNRLVAVLKMRFSSHDQTLRELVLDPRGVRVLSPAETSPDVLEEAATSGGFVPPNAAPTSQI